MIYSPKSEDQAIEVDLAAVEANIGSVDISALESDVTALQSATSNVDNTSDANKPVSTAQQTALDNKLDDSQFDGLAQITVGTTAPSTPAVGDLWIDTN